MVLNSPAQRCFWFNPGNLTLFVRGRQHIAAAQQSVLPLCQTPRWLLTFLHRCPAWIDANPSRMRVSPRDRRLPHSTLSIAASPQRREEVVCPASGAFYSLPPPAYLAGGRRHRTFRRKAVTNVTGGGFVAVSSVAGKHWSPLRKLCNIVDYWLDGLVWLAPFWWRSTVCHAFRVNSQEILTLTKCFMEYSKLPSSNIWPVLTRFTRVVLCNQAIHNVLLLAKWPECFYGGTLSLGLRIMQ